MSTKIKKSTHRVYGGSAVSVSDGRRVTSAPRPTARPAAERTSAAGSRSTTGPGALRGRLDGAGDAKAAKPTKDELRALIDALSVLAALDLPAEAADEERAAFEAKKTAALDKLSAYFQGQLPERYQEKASAIRQTVSALTVRVAKVERASARATIARIQAQTAAMRHEARYGSCAGIERAGRNTMRAIAGAAPRAGS